MVLFTNKIAIDLLQAYASVSKVMGNVIVVTPFPWLVLVFCNLKRLMQIVRTKRQQQPNSRGYLDRQYHGELCRLVDSQPEFALYHS